MNKQPYLFMFHFLVNLTQSMFDINSFYIEINTQKRIAIVEDLWIYEYLSILLNSNKQYKSSISNTLTEKLNLNFKVKVYLINYLYCFRRFLIILFSFSKQNIDELYTSYETLFWAAIFITQFCVIKHTK